MKIEQIIHFLYELMNKTLLFLRLQSPLDKNGNGSGYHSWKIDRTFKNVRMRFAHFYVYAMALITPVS